MPKEICEICEFPLILTWGIAHGLAHCTACGTPYWLIRKGKKLPEPQLGIKPEALPLYEKWGKAIRSGEYGSDEFGKFEVEHPELAPVYT